MDKKNRLSKLLASAGVASRRAAEQLIFDGRVTVNGAVVLLPQTPVSFDDAIAVDGKPIKKAEEKAYFMLNKPKGYLCSNRRLSARSKLVTDLFDENLRLFTVGRLDKETEGLIIVTNDGHFANKLIHPSRGVEKEYIAKTNKEITPKHLEILARGCVVEDVFCKKKKKKKVVTP
ncbi:MAG: rRNA pseudouridine synthase, partial [Chlamydiia bacterium]|nr:rRNA pseudouridine synthase [Chlamydiia bacterium]